MNVHIAEACGFCSGVRRAVAMASEAEAGTYTLGPIIHNPQVVDRLASQGVCPVESLQEVERGHTVLIRSHGIGPQYYEEAEQRGLIVVDATCPHVKKAQYDAKKVIDEGKNLVIIAGH